MSDIAPDNHSDISISIDHAQRLIVMTRCGPFNLRGLRASIERQAADGLWSYRTLCDERANTSVPTTAEVRELADYVKALIRAHGRRGPVAIVTHNVTTYGMGRMYGALTEPTALNVQIFRDRDEAESWLAAQAATPAELIG